MKRIKGIFRDTSPISQPEGTYLDARDLEINAELGTFSSDSGNVSQASLSGAILANVMLSDGRVVLFVKREVEEVEQSVIVVFNPNSGLTELATPDFGFGNNLQARATTNRNGDQLIFWVDDSNPPRTLNLDKPLPNDLWDYELMPNLLSKPDGVLTEIESYGGSLPTGTYWFFACMVAEDKTRTNWIPVCGNINVSRDVANLGGSATLTPTSKAIRISISGIDTRYPMMRIAVISRNEGVIGPVKVLSDIPVVSDTMSILHTGDESFTPTDIDEIVVDRSSYVNAKAIEINDGFLYLGNLTSAEDLGYQKYANAITCQHHTTVLEDALFVNTVLGIPMVQNTADGYADLKIAATKRGYRLGEVYAFYIAFMLTDGTMSRAYHIPGRTSEEVVSDGGAFATTSINVTANNLNTSQKFTLTINGHTTDEIEILAADTIDQIETKIFDKLIAQSDIAIENSIVYLLSDLSLTRNTKGVFTGAITKTVTEVDTAAGGTPATGSWNVDVNPAVNETFDVVIDGNAVSVTIVNTDNASDIAIKIATAVNADPTVGVDWLATPIGSLVTIQSQSNGTVWNGLVLSNTASFLIVNTNTSGGTDDFPGDITMTHPNFSGGVAPTLFDELDPGVSLDHRFQEKAEIGSNGMAYWQNADEVYPDIEDSEVWTVTDGEGQDTLTTLAGTNVRHHRFPGPAHLDAYTDGDVVIHHVRFSNIRVPEEIRSKVLGFKIYYAKRTESNKLVVDSSVIHMSRTADGKYMPQHVNQAGPATDNFVGHLFPPHSLANRQSLGSVTHLNLHGRTKALRTTSDNSSPSDTNFFYEDHYSNRVKTPDNESYLNPVVGINYVDSAEDDLLVYLRTSGLGLTVNNHYGNSMVMVKTSFSNQSNVGYVICDMLSMKQNLYNSFRNQLLVDTGYWQEIDSNHVYSTGDVFGGDTFTGAFTYKTSRKNPSHTQFDIGIHSVVMQSDSNICLRGIGDNPWETWWPLNPVINSVFAPRYTEAGLPNYDWAKGNNTDTYDNYIRLNPDFTDTNDLKPAFPSFDLITQTRFSTRVIRNQKQKDNESMRVFLQDDLIDLDPRRGELIRLSIYDNVLIPHMRRALVRTRGAEELKTGDFRAFIGSGDIFSVKPEEILYSDQGSHGLSKASHALSTPFGYVFIDSDEKKVFMLSDKGMQEISNNGLRNEFLSSAGEYRLGYDPNLRRILVSVGTKTFAFHPETDMWMTSHSWNPDCYFNSRLKLFTLRDGQLWRHGEGGQLYGQPFNSVFKFVENRSETVTKTVESITAIIDTLDDEGNVLDLCFGQYRVSNDSQDTGIKSIAPGTNIGYLGNARKIRGQWNINGIRTVGLSGNYGWAYRQRIQGKYVVVEMIFESDTDKRIKIHDVEVNFKAVIR